MNETSNTRVAPANSADDDALVIAAKRGDEHAFGILVTRYQRKIFVAALRYTRFPEDAEDIVQQAFQKAFIHLQKFAGRSSFSTWVTGIAINEALMFLRKDRANREVSFDDTDEEEATVRGRYVSDPRPDPETDYSLQEETRALLTAMNTLTPQLRAAIELRELAELSTDETARRLGVSVAAVKARVFHGRTKLRKRLRHLRASRAVHSAGMAGLVERNCSSLRLEPR